MKAKMNRRKFLKFLGIGSAVLPVVGVLGKDKHNTWPKEWNNISTHTNESCKPMTLEQLQKAKETMIDWNKYPKEFETYYGELKFQDYARNLFSRMARNEEIKTLSAT